MSLLRQYYGCYCALALLAISSGVNGADEADYLSLSLEAALGVEVVTVSKRSQTVAEAPSIVSVFSRRDIERMGMPTLVGVLQYAPGVEVSMSPEGRYRLAIRGVRKAGNILLMIDGQRISDFYDGSSVFDLPTDMIEQVELIRGPGSALYGTNAVVGVVNVRTIKSGVKRLKLTAGNDNTAALSANYQHSENQHQLAINFSHRQSDGFNKNVTVNNSLSTDGQLASTQRYLEDTFLQLSYEYQGWQLSGVASHREHGPWSGAGFDLGPDSIYRDSQLAAQLSKGFQLSPSVLFKPALSLDYLDIDNLLQSHPEGYIASGNVFPDGALTKEQYQAQSVGLDAQFVIDLGADTRHLLGVVFQQSHLNDYELTRNFIAASNEPQPSFENYDGLDYEQDHKTRTVKAAYLQGEYHWQNYDLTLGFRYDDYDDSGNSFSPRAGLVYRANERLSFKWLFAEAFRAPTFKELYDSTSIGRAGVRSNPDLDPETVSTTEFGIEYKFDKAFVRGNIFYTETEDIIAEFDPFGGGARGSNENLGDTRSYGAEIEVTAKLSPAINLVASYAQFRRDFQWADNMQYDGACCRDFLQEQGETELVHAPRIRANLGLQFEMNRWSGFTGVSYGGKSGPNARSAIEWQAAVVSGGGVEIDDYLQADIHISYRLSDNAQLHLGANNLGADKYSDPDSSTKIGAFGRRGLIQPGSSYWLSFEARL